MKKVLVHVTPEIIAKAVPSQFNNCLLYHAIIPFLKDEYISNFQVGVFNAGFYDSYYNRLGLIMFSKEVEEYIASAIRYEVRGSGETVPPQSFEIEISEEFLKD